MCLFLGAATFFHLKLTIPPRPQSAARGLDKLRYLLEKMLLAFARKWQSRQLDQPGACLPSERGHIEMERSGERDYSERCALVTGHGKLQDSGDAWEQK